LKILITGSKGQLGKQLISNIPKKLNGEKIEIIAAHRDLFSLENLKTCRDFLKDRNPNWVINAAAYTDVEKAEIDKSQAKIINGIAPKVIAEEVHKNGGKLLHISTDYVFDGKQNFAYKTNQKRNPINYYGKSKCIGEENIESVFKDSQNGIILRTSWIIGDTGNNFLISILNLLKKGKDLKIISDQIGAPTNSNNLAKICWNIIDRFESGIAIPKTLHWCDAGIASWYDIAQSISEISQRYGIIIKSPSIMPINSSQYPAKADRPKFSLLDCKLTTEVLNLQQIYWKKGIENSLKNILKS